MGIERGCVLGREASVREPRSLAVYGELGKVGKAVLRGEVMEVGILRRRSGWERK